MDHVLTADLTAEKIAALDDDARAMLRAEQFEVLTASALEDGAADAERVTFAFKPDGSAAVMLDDDETVYDLAAQVAMYEAMMADEEPAAKPAADAEKPAPEAAS